MASYGLSMLGNAVAAVVLPLIVLHSTGDATDAGILAAATAVPAVLAGLFMGGVIDRVHRRSASIATDLVSAAAIAALPIVDLVTDLTLGWFVLLGIVGSFGDVPGLTAREALLPQVARHAGVGVDRLVAQRELVGAVVLLAGPAAAAGLVVLLDGSGALWVTAATSFAAAMLTLLLPRRVGALDADATPVGSSPRAAVAHLREGWSLLFRRSPFLLSTTLVSLLLAVVLTAIQGLILPVHFIRLGQEGRLGMVLSALALGLLLGAGLYAAIGDHLTRRRWFAAGMVGSVGGVALVSALPATAPMLAGAVTLGVSIGVVGTVTGVLMTERIPDHLRGRVTGTQNAVMTAAPSLGVLGAAVMVERVSLGTAGAVVAGVWALTAALALVAPPLRDLEPAPTDAPGR
nr:MFS transporter [Nocardioides lijunqiniae]